MNLNFGMKCRLCDNTDDKQFYIMPLQERVGLNDIINSTDKYKITCKKCGKSYLFHFAISEIDIKTPVQENK